tara:strand:- start:326 stop:619 length:294 start_codon:yes stop_codon:yes gene_type:complete
MPYTKKNKSVGGRKANRIERLTKRRDKAYSKAAKKSIEQGANEPFGMGAGMDTRAYKKSERLSEKIDKLKGGKKKDKKYLGPGPFAGTTSRGSKRNA